jgi:transposase
MDVIVDRCAGLDIGKRQVQACVRGPDGAGGRRSQVRTFETFTASLEALARWLETEGVSQVVMEATGPYWKPVWYVLEESRVRVAVGQRPPRQDPPRPQDRRRRRRLAGRVARARLVARQFRAARAGAAAARPDPLPQEAHQDAGIKLDSVASDVLGVSGRAMLRALLAGERDPAVLADLAKGVLRRKIPDLQQALRGRFDAHHGVLIGITLDHIEHLEAAIAALDHQINEVVAPFAAARDRLTTIPGVGKRAAETIVAEIGVDMSRFPTPGHLASWAGMCPGNNVTGGKSRSGRTTKGNLWLRDILVQCAWSAARTRDTYLAAQFWRLARRIGKKKAAIAVGHSILVAAWHILHDDVDYQDLGGDWFARKANDDHRRDHAIRNLHDLGYQVTLQRLAG